MNIGPKLWRYLIAPLWFTAGCCVGAGWPQWPVIVTAALLDMGLMTVGLICERAAA